MNQQVLLPREFNGVMEPIAVQFNTIKADDYWYEVKWDGVRLITVIDRGKITVINRHYRDKTIQFPELQELVRHLNCRTAVIDGEGVVIQNGRPDFAAVIKRNNRQAKPQPPLIRELPLTYMMFDLLVHNDQNLLSWSYENRKQKLHEILTTAGQFQEVEKIENGTDLWTAIQALNLEGIVAKKRGSSYHSGKRHHDWFKIKHRRQEWCVIGGFTRQGSNINALLIGKPADHRLRYVGRVGLTGECSHDEKFLSALVEKVDIVNPFLDLKAPKNEFRFTAPLWGALVEYAEWTPELKLRQPILKGVKPISMLTTSEVESNA